MKEINVSGITYLNQIEGTDQWYYGLDYLSGDLYEAEEIFKLGREVQGSHLYLIHYPSGETYNPVPLKPFSSLGSPVYSDGIISFPEVDFRVDVVRVHSFDCKTRQTTVQTEIALSEFKDCYNLRLYVSPLMLCRHSNDGDFDIIWPVKKTIKTTVREALCFRDNDRLIFSRWEEDPDYREETVIRDINSGDIIEILPGNIMLMPDGSQWHVY